MSAGRALKRLVLWAMAASIAAAVAAVVFMKTSDDADALYLERTWRRTLHDVGGTLPGTPDLARFDERMKNGGFTLGAPVLIRIFKREFELELWMKKGDTFERFAIYPICKWSGLLGPKLAQGDRQAPEGFYTVDQSALNPNSSWHRSFNLGYPNAFDRSQGRTGSLIMVHGGCGSIGCYAMTNAVIDEIWKLVTNALSGGQQRFQVQVYPFRMTEQRWAAAESSSHAAFWKTLKQGYDAFEASGVPLKVSVCKGAYKVEPGAKGSDGSAPIADAC